MAQVFQLLMSADHEFEENQIVPKDQKRYNLILSHLLRMVIDENISAFPCYFIDFYLRCSG